MTLTDIAGYLPHGLIGYHPQGAICKIDIAFAAKYGVELCNYRPVLRPMNDLYSDVVEANYNEGKPFIPIMELTKASRDEVYPTINEEGKCVFTSSGDEYYFSWIQNGLYFRTMKKDRGMFIRPAHTFFQSNLFDLLHRWHFDYRGLIDAGMAVSIHDLNKDPYQ